MFFYRFGIIGGRSHDFQSLISYLKITGDKSVDIWACDTDLIKILRKLFQSSAG